MHDINLNIRIPSNLKDKLDAYAKERYTSTSEVVRQAIINTIGGTTMTTFFIDDMTVYHRDKYGEIHDLNAEGEPCQTADELREFIRELYAQGTDEHMSMAERDALLEEAGRR